MRCRKRFMTYAKQAIAIYGVERVASAQPDSEWKAMITELGREGEMAA